MRLTPLSLLPKTLIAAGQLDEQTKLLAAELAAGTDVTGDRWRTLAVYQDAADKLNDATVAANGQRRYLKG